MAHQNSAATSQPADLDPRRRANAAALAAFIKAGPLCPPVRATLANLMSRVPPGDGPGAIASIMRAAAVMDAFAALPAADRDALEGKLSITETLGLTPAEVLAVRLRRTREVFASSPILDAAWNEMEAAEQAQRQARETEDAARHEAEQAAEARRVEVVGFMLTLHDRGVALQVAREGRAMAWPACRLSPDELVFLHDRNAELAAAVLAEWA